MNPLEDASSVERGLIQRASLRKSPLIGSLELLPLCNMSCEMCYVHMTKEEMDRKGRLLTVDEWVEIARQMQAGGTLFLLLTGGEPLLYPGFKELYLALRNMGMILTLNTNGTLLDEEWADFFAEYKPRRINITLYGGSGETYEKLCHYRGGFERTIHALRLLKEKGVDVKINMSVTRWNHEDQFEVIRIGQELDIPVRMDTYMVPAQRERELAYDRQSRLKPEQAALASIEYLRRCMPPETYRQYVHDCVWEVEHILPEEGPGRMRCNAGSCSFTVNWQGRMRPCVIMTEPEVDLLEVGFDKGWTMLKEEVCELTLSPKCSGCNLRPVCKNCSGNAICETGSTMGVGDYLCRYAAETYRILKIDAKELLGWD